jgi:Spy/CpxP family protein refolding chaperone
MTTQRKLTVLVFVLLAAAALIAAAVAQGPGGPGPMQGPPGGQGMGMSMMQGPMPMPGRCVTHVLHMPMRLISSPMAAPLELTEEQQTKIEALQKTASDRIMSLNQEQMKATDALMKTLADPKSDQAAIRKAADAAAKIEDAILSAEVEFLGGVKALLNAEQNQKLQGMLQRFTMPMGPGMGAPNPMPGARPPMSNMPGGPPPGGQAPMGPPPGGQPPMGPPPGGEAPPPAPMQ